MLICIKNLWVLRFCKIRLCFWILQFGLDFSPYEENAFRLFVRLVSPRIQLLYCTVPGRALNAVRGRIRNLQVFRIQMKSLRVASHDICCLIFSKYIFWSYIKKKMRATSVNNTHIKENGVKKVSNSAMSHS